jgi:hypothetical protein
VVDEEALADYQSAPEPLRSKISENLTTDDDGDVCFRLTEDGVCALLDQDGLCPIQRHWGEKHLCTHCGAYPRFIEEYGCLTESCAAISCPEAARLVMEAGVLPLRERDDGENDEPFDGVDEKLLDGLVHSRESAFHMVCDRSQPIWGRLSALLDYADGLENCIYMELPLENMEAPRPGPAGDERNRQALAVRLLELLAGLEPLREEWPQLLRRRASELEAMDDAAYRNMAAEYQAACPQWEEQLERLACYFLFRHWPKAVNDDLLYGRAALTAASCVALYHLSALAWKENKALSLQDQALLWAAFSREVEHLDENFEALVDTLADQERWPLAQTL